jgi:hypothetical protein
MARGSGWAATPAARVETVVRSILSVRGGHRRTPAWIHIAVGCAAVVLSAILAAAVYPPNVVEGRAVIMAVVVGVYAAKVAEMRVVLGVVGASMLLFAWFLVNGFGEFTTPGLGAAGYLFLIAFAAMLGRGHRWTRAPRETGEVACSMAKDR